MGKDKKIVPGKQSAFPASLGSPPLLPVPRLEDAFPPEREKLSSALSLYRIEAVTDPDGPLYEAAYQMLDGFFGAKGELEDKEVLRALVRQRDVSFGEDLFTRYHLLLAWHNDQIVGVRDCYTEVDPTRRLCLIALSHSFIVPEHRRSGLASLFRAYPIAAARGLVQEFFESAKDIPIVSTAEMEPIEPSQPETLIRLIAYGKSGFSVIDPSYVPYAQPDFRAQDLGLSHWGMPLLSVIRWVGQEDKTELPLELATVFPRHYNSFHRRYTPPEHVDLMVQNALETLKRRNVTKVPLLSLPAHLGDQTRITPLLRALVLPLYPEKLRGG